jgi:hypothetical protein
MIGTIMSVSEPCERRFVAGLPAAMNTEASE